ncbi:hypothetical protein [Larkinella knui]|uniref:Uncharacterized protein n=1 Tax=Larkinella knui TaxID=2025310 RepID=A0A3P1CHI5_9BACT|nr:hypothetical protein [Larkinella knui]RRB12506.1 hypothetical protein EHT87_20115 [Larkinella knui]
MKALFPREPAQFRFVNQFGPRFLKNRIQMMNRATRSRRSWLVYVVLFAVTGLVTAVAAVEKQQKAPLTWIKKKPEASSKPVAVHSVMIRQRHLVADLEAVQKPVEELVAKPVVSLPDSAQILEEVPTVKIEKQSRYVAQKGKLVYWVITPKMSFADLTELKQTIEKLTSFTFDYNRITFDPFQVYIDAIAVKVHKEKGSAGSVYEGDESDQPIKSIGGYLAESGSLGMGLSSFGMPESLQQLVKEDEKAALGLVAENWMAYLIHKNQKTGAGSSSTVKGSWLRENPGRRNENLGVFINASGQVQLYHTERVTVLINGKEMNASEVPRLDPKQLHTVIVKDVSDESAGPGRKKRYVQIFLNQ